VWFHGVPTLSQADRQDSSALDSQIRSAGDTPWFTCFSVVLGVELVWIPGLAGVCGSSPCVTLVSVWQGVDSRNLNGCPDGLVSAISSPG